MKQYSSQESSLNSPESSDSEVTFSIGEEHVVNNNTSPTPDPIGIPANTAPRDVTRDHEVLLEQIARFDVGFDLKTFPQYIASWLPRLNKALPGSYEHLLLLMYDDLDHYVGLQQSMAKGKGIPNFLETHLDQVKHADRLRNIGRAYEWSNPRYRSPATLRARGPPCVESKRRDEAFFFSELRMLRDLLAPVRDPSRPVFWVTCRSDRADETAPQFAASQDLIDGFKAHLMDALYDHHKNYTIYSPLSPTTDQGKSLFSLKQHRLDACKGTLYWEKYPPEGIQFTEFYQLYKEHIISTDPNTARALGFLPPLNPPLPNAKVSFKLGLEFENPWAPITYESTMLTVLVRTAQWLALARGFPAVHLFCDITRLFTIYGVDVANATQVEYCKLLINMRLPRDMPPFPVLSFPFTDTMLYERNPEYFRDVQATNKSLARALIHEETLLSRDDDSISWDYPLQTLTWVTRGAKTVLVLKKPFQRCRFDPGHVVDTEWEDFVAAHLEREDPRALFGVVLPETSPPDKAVENDSHKLSTSTGEDSPDNVNTNAISPKDRVKITTPKPSPDPPPRLESECTFSQQELAVWLETQPSRPRMIPRSNSHRGPSQNRPW